VSGLSLFCAADGAPAEFFAMFNAFVLDHVANPRNVGPLETATHQGVAGIPGEGPYMLLWFEVTEERICRAAYQTFGCPAAMASGSLTAELLTGRTIAQALTLTAADIIRLLHGLPEGKEDCPQLVIAALKNAFGKE
jgi:nitrogen fixation NifU-like protein